MRVIGSTRVMIVMGSTNINAIVIGSRPYSDSSKIVKIFTQDLGLVSIFVRTFKSKVSRKNSSIWQPLAAISLTDFKRKNTQNLGTFKEAERVLKANNLLSDARRTSVAFFMAELINKSIGEDTPLPDVFELLWNTVQLLDSAEDVSNLHLFFTANLVYRLGIMPSMGNLKDGGDVKSLNLDTGEWSNSHISLTPNSHLLDVRLAIKMCEILGMEFDNMASLKLNKQDHKELLLGMVMFIQLHHAGLKEIKSYEVLETVFS